MIIHNLNSFKEHKNYYDLYLNNNTKLNSIIQNIISKYKFDYEPEKYYRFNEKNIRTRNIYELDGLTIILNAIIEKNIYGYCIKTGKKYNCEKMRYSKITTVTKFTHYSYHFNCSSDDEFIIFFSWEYFSPVLIYYPKDKIIYNISYRYSNITTTINDILNNLSLNIYYPINNYITYAFGIMHNAGHHLWQEIYGLMLLLEYNLIDNIDEFIIYKFDYLNISEILKNKFSKKVTYITSDSVPHNITINLSKHYINNSTIDLFKNIYDLKDNTQNNEINIMFDIRTNNRIWLNQIPIIINIMNWIKETYPNYGVNFFMSGFYTYEQNGINSTIYNFKKEIDKQNKIFHTIKNLVSFPIYSLINLNLSEIIKICQKIDMCISNAGSGIGFFYQTIFNKQTICFTTKKNTYDFNLQRYAFENYISNCIFLDSNHIIDNKENFSIKLGHLLPFVIDKLNKIITNS